MSSSAEGLAPNPLRRAIATGLVAAIALLGISGLSARAGAQEMESRGAYLFRAAGCYACHTEPGEGAKPLAGGHPLKTPFGTFYSPNITPDPEHGLGNWSLNDFGRALRLGIAPDGSHYYPAFPYPSYTGMTDRDLADLWTYLQSVEPVARPNQEHDLDFPFGFRFLAGAWKWLYFEPRPFSPDPAEDERWNRGAYLTRHLGHCGECHTPRGALGALQEDRYLSGAKTGPGGKKVPNITPHDEDGIGAWSVGDITFFLQIGVKPDGDVAGGAMDDVIREGTGYLSEEDRAAIAHYLRSVEALPGP